MAFLDTNAKALIDAYNADPDGRRYNQIAEAVYEARRTIGDALSPQFECHILDGLVGFGIGRVKGGRAALKPRLHGCLNDLRNIRDLDRLRDSSLTTADLAAVRPVLLLAYDCLAKAGKLHPLKKFHVGATKTLHWLFPDLFLMLDSNVARAFREHLRMGFRRSTQPGYSSEKYFSCLQAAQNKIRFFGADLFRQLEPDTPEARIFDKIAFIVGKRSI